MPALWKPLIHYVSLPTRVVKNIRVKIGDIQIRALSWWRTILSAPTPPSVRIFEHQNGDLDLWMHDTVSVYHPPANVRVVTSDASGTGGGFYEGSTLTQQTSLRRNMHAFFRISSKHVR